jgi:hypothetical protein
LTFGGVEERDSVEYMEGNVEEMKEERDRKEGEEIEIERRVRKRERGGVGCGGGGGGGKKIGKLLRGGFEMNIRSLLPTTRTRIGGIGGSVEEGGEGGEEGEERDEYWFRSFPSSPHSHLLLLSPPPPLSHLFSLPFSLWSFFSLSSVFFLKSRLLLFL